MCESQFEQATCPGGQESATLCASFGSSPSCACSSMDLLKWECIIPGPEKGDWAGGFYPLTMEFSEEYPSKPPKVRTWLPRMYDAHQQSCRLDRSGSSCMLPISFCPFSSWRRGRHVTSAHMRNAQSQLSCRTFGPHNGFARAVQVPTKLLPSECVPIGHRVPVDHQRGRGVPLLHACLYLFMFAVLATRL